MVLQVLRPRGHDPLRPVYLTYAVPPEKYPYVREIPMTGPLDEKEYPVRQRIMRVPFMRLHAMTFSPVGFW